jgi:hypothetical protein
MLVTCYYINTTFFHHLGIGVEGTKNGFLVHPIAVCEIRTESSIQKIISFLVHHVPFDLIIITPTL